MKLLSLKFAVILFFIRLGIFGNIEVWAADWKFWYEETFEYDSGLPSSPYTIKYYYDMESIAKPSRNTVKVWVKDVDQRDKMSWKEMKIDERIEEGYKEYQQLVKQNRAEPLDKFTYKLTYGKFIEGLAKGHCIKYHLTLYQFNCSERTYCSYLESRTYDKEGVLLYSFKMDPIIIEKWTYSITPDDNEIEKLYKKVCR